MDSLTELFSYGYSHQLQNHGLHNETSFVAGHNSPVQPLVVALPLRGCLLHYRPTVAGNPLNYSDVNLVNIQSCSHPTNLQYSKRLFSLGNTRKFYSNIGITVKQILHIMHFECIPDPHKDNNALQAGSKA